MRITVQIPLNLDVKIREHLSIGDTEAVRHLLLKVVQPEVENFINNEPPPLSAEEFAVLADQLVDTFMEYVGEDCPPLSDYAVRRAGIYGEPES